MERAGVQSAGSSPGPLCYGRDGERPAITDAFVALGYIGRFDPDYSAIEIDADKARAAVGTVAGRIGRNVEETAQAIVDSAPATKNQQGVCVSRRKSRLTPANHRSGW